MPLTRVGACVLLCGTLAAQGSTVYFSTDFAELSASGVGTTLSVAGNQAGTFDDEEILLVEPNASAPYFARACSSYATLSAWFGDADGDGEYTDSIIGDIDALYLPDSAPNPPSLFDFYVSFRFDTGNQGILGGGSPILDGDVVRLLPGGGFLPFITEAQIATAMEPGAPSTTIDVNAFTVDQGTGDLYWSMIFEETVNGTQVFDGGVVRLPAGMYTANPNGTVQSVTPGGAEIVLHESEVDAIFTNAGFLNPWDVGGLELDPNGGAFVSSSTGLALPNLWMLDEQAANGPVIISSASLGSVADWNGVTFLTAADVGLAPTGFSEIATRNLNALDFRSVPIGVGPLMLDALPTLIPTPGPMTLDVGGGVPSSAVVVILNFAAASTPGGVTGRTPLVPLLSFLNFPGTFGELYVDDATDPLGALAVPVALDGQGYGSFSLTFPALPSGIGIVWQAFDLLTVRLSTPVVIISG